MATVVMARIASIDAPHRAAVVVRLPEGRGIFSAVDQSAWITALGGLAAALVILSLTSDGWTLSDLASPKVGGGMIGMVAMPTTTIGALALAASLGLYVAGLFAPLGRKVHGGSRRPRAEGL